MGFHQFIVDDGSSRLFDSLESPFALHDVLVIPLDLLGFLEPSSQMGLFDLGDVVVEHRRVFELLSDNVEPFLVEVGTTPEHQAYS